MAGEAPLEAVPALPATPRVVAPFPVMLELAPGTYAWCHCGRSRRQPFCDGSHAGTGLEPHMFTLEETRTIAVCLCKQTDNPPHCDGIHLCLGRL